MSILLSFMVSLFNVLGRSTAAIIDRNLIFIFFSSFDMSAYSLKPISYI